MDIHKAVNPSSLSLFKKEKKLSKGYSQGNQYTLTEHPRVLKTYYCKLGIEAHTFNTNTQEAEARESLNSRPVWST